MLPKNSSALTRINIKRDPKEYAGDYGEEKVNALLEQYSQRKCLFSKTLSRFAYLTPESSRENDFIFIFRKGVFVIEVKNWSGTIRGKASDENWLVTKRYKNAEQRKNPLVQVHKYVTKVTKVLQGRFPIYPLVIFASDNVTLLGIRNVISSYDISSYFDKFTPSKVLTDKEIMEVYQILSASKNSDNVTIQQHKKNAIRTKKYLEDKRKYSDLPAIIKNTRKKYY